MQDWISHVLSGGQIGFAFFPAVFLIGLLGSASSCCALPVVGAVVGYAGSRTAMVSRRDLLLVGLFFMLGTTLALTVLGAFTGLVGNLGGSSLGKYWQFAAGMLLVLFGLLSLNLVKLPLPKFDVSQKVLGRGMIGAMSYGLVLGGATTACTLGCNPLLPMALGVAVLHNTVLMSALTLTVFALGFSLPLGLGLVGIGFGLGKLGTRFQRIVPAMRIAAGVLLIGVGFYLLAKI